MESDNKLFLLDAYALIYRAYYAFIKNPRINSKGFNTSAILGFVNTLEEVLKKENPSHIGVAFDPSGPTFRHEAFEQYKAQREETPEAIRLSVPIIKEIIHAYRIPILEVAGYEADDVIGTLATEAGRQGITTYMMTPDKDYGQLVTDNVFMYRPKHTGGFEVMGIEEVKAKFDIQSPAQVIDMLGLMGDSSDNIPGCPGVGEKTAQKLITEFGSIENLLKTRLLALLAIALLCGAAVSVAGPIGFIGLVVPQLIRRLVSVDLRVMVPLSALCGALVLLMADIAARTLFTPYELATGVMTALVGAPVFILMASRMFK